MKATAALLLATLATACSTTPGTGWSRAPDLSVYSAMRLFGEVAQEQEIFCQGFRPAGVRRDWSADFAGREARIAAALASRHGAQALSDAEAAAVATRSVPCRDWPNDRWRDQYVRMLRLLEARLGLA
ncbi:MAG TPA: hypothetical protein VF704_05370 [Allosphingosinicella sp.]|jgi:hypothetical protein